MNYAILRLKKRSLAEAKAMARHALREGTTPNADPSKRQENTVLGHKTADKVMAAIEAKLPENRRKNAVPAIELFIGGSPEALKKMSRKQQDEYFNSAIDWAGKRFGGQSNIVSAVIHRDETTPHAQLLLVPLLDGKLNARALVGNRQTMKDMQTEFAAKVGEPHGLRRGEEGSRAKHTSIRQFYGAMEAAGRHDALPPRVPMPRAIEEPGIFSGKAEKAAYAKREAEREAARQANAKRQAEIERLAKLGLAVHGRGRRRLVDSLAEAKEAEAKAAGERQLAVAARKECDSLEVKKGRLEVEVGLLIRRRDTLARQVDDLQATPTNRPRPRPGG